MAECSNSSVASTSNTIVKGSGTFRNGAIVAFIRSDKYRTIGRITYLFPGGTMKSIVILMCLLFINSIGSAQTRVPNGQLSITYQRVENGILAKSYHEIELSCHSGECELQTISFNFCWDMGPSIGKYSFVQVRQTSTKTGDLKIVSATNNNLVLKEDLAEATFTYRFSYSLRPGTFDFDWVTDFSGGASKNSEVLGQVVVWQLVPLRTTSSSVFEDVKLDCPIRVAALPGH